jgi:hypothetical protein
MIGGVGVGQRRRTPHGRIMIRVGAVGGGKSFIKICTVATVGLGGLDVREGMTVGVGVSVGLGVVVAVDVFVGVGVFVSVCVAVGVGVFVNVAVGVAVGLGVLTGDTIGRLRALAIIMPPAISTAIIIIFTRNLRVL